jgi:uncharacterized Zn finger protein (UPF0148 family)
VKDDGKVRTYKVKNKCIACGGAGFTSKGDECPICAAVDAVLDKQGMTEKQADEVEEEIKEPQVLEFRDIFAKKENMEKYSRPQYDLKKKGQAQYSYDGWVYGDTIIGNYRYV